MVCENDLLCVLAGGDTRLNPLHGLSEEAEVEATVLEENRYSSLSLLSRMVTA